MNIGRTLTRSAGLYPDRPAVSYGEICWTYATFNERVDELVGALQGQGFDRGDRVAFFMWNRPELLQVLFAALKGGFCAVPVNARSSADEVAWLAHDAGVRALFFGPEQATVVDGVRHAAGLRCDLIAVGGEPAPAAATLDQLVATHCGVVADCAETADDDICWLFYTSGTTGRPKGAMLTHANLHYLVLG